MMDSGHSFIAALLSAVSLICTLDVRSKATDLARDLAGHQVAHSVEEACPDCLCPSCSPCPACNCPRSPLQVPVDWTVWWLFVVFFVGVLSGILLVVGLCACYQCCRFRGQSSSTPPAPDRRFAGGSSPSRPALQAITEFESDSPVYTPRSLRR
jgi:hypothetical protein